jgi:hypothetical protein
MIFNNETEEEKSCNCNYIGLNHSEASEHWKKIPQDVSIKSLEDYFVDIIFEEVEKQSCCNKCFHDMFDFDIEDSHDAFIFRCNYLNDDLPDLQSNLLFSNDIFVKDRFKDIFFDIWGVGPNCCCNYLSLERQPHFSHLWNSFHNAFESDDEMFHSDNDFLEVFFVNVMNQLYVKFCKKIEK